MLCSCSAHECGRALASPATVRSAGAVPSTIAAIMRGETKARGASRRMCRSPWASCWAISAKKAIRPAGCRRSISGLDDRGEQSITALGLHRHFATAHARAARHAGAARGLSRAELWVAGQTGTSSSKFCKKNSAKGSVRAAGGRRNSAWVAPRARSGGEAVNAGLAVLRFGPSCRQRPRSSATTGAATSAGSSVRRDPEFAKKKSATALDAGSRCGSVGASARA